MEWEHPDAKDVLLVIAVLCLGMHVWIPVYLSISQPLTIHLIWFQIRFVQKEVICSTCMCASQKPFDYVLHFINCFCSATQVGVQKPSKNWQEPRKFQEADFMFGLYIIQVRGCPAILCDSKIIFLVVSLNPQSFSFLRFLLSHLSASFFLTYISLHAPSLWSRYHAILEHWKI